MDRFTEIAEAKIQRLEEEDEHLSATLRGIEARRAELQSEIVAGKTALAYYREAMGLANAAWTGMAPNVITITTTYPKPRRSRTGSPTMADRLEEFMVSNGGDAPVSELADRLVAQGIYPEDQRQSLYRRVYAALLRDKRFFKIDKGRFGLIPQGESRTYRTEDLTNVVSPPIAEESQ
jgi:hypothetical protein